MLHSVNLRPPCLKFYSLWLRYTIPWGTWTQDMCDHLIEAIIVFPLRKILQLIVPIDLAFKVQRKRQKLLDSTRIRTHNLSDQGWLGVIKYLVGKSFADVSLIGSSQACWVDQSTCLGSFLKRNIFILGHSRSLFSIFFVFS